MSSKKRLNINDLRVIDLRAELEKRNLDKSGVRGVLIQRLSKQLEEDGHDPKTYVFELPETATPIKKTRRTGSAVDQESEETPAIEDMIVQDDAGEEEETEQSVNQENEQPSDSTMEVDENEKANRKRESKEVFEASQPKKPCIEKEKEDDHKNENNTDAEDSINLDIGDDELLNEETDNTSKPEKKGQEFTCVLLARSEKMCKIGVKELRRALHAEELTGKPRLPSELGWEQALTHTVGIDEPSPAPEAAGDETTPVEPCDQPPHDDSEAPATSNDGENNDNEQKDDKDKEGDGDKKEKKDDGKEGGARNLWVSGLSGDTRAKDLKQLCSKHGKVIGAKVVTNARTPGSRCYGYVTMASAQDAENCIKNLHRTELHGRMISVEKAKSESESASRRQPSRSERRSSKDAKDDKERDAKDGEKSGESKSKKDGEVSGADSHRSTSHTREKSARSDKDRVRRSTRSRERRRSPREVLSFNKIWKERDEARARERSRAAREEERRRRAAEEALRERERRMRQEKQRLAFERDQLRAEREKIEREKNELLRLERERHRLEREKLELERLELKRAQLRLEEERRKRGYENSSYRKAASPPPDPAYERDSRHKRAPPPPITSSRPQFEAPPPPRFEVSAAYERSADKRTDRDRDYKRDYPPRHVPSSNMKYSSNGGTNDDTRQPMPPGPRPKEPGRSFESREARGPYRPSPPANKQDPRWQPSSRYPDSAAPSKSSSGGGESWSAGGGGETRYAGGGGYEARYPAHYQPPPPGAPYPDRYAPPARDYPRKY